MIKLVTVDEIRKQVDRMQQNGKHLEKTAQRMSGFRSKLSLGIIIGFNGIIRLGFYSSNDKLDIDERNLDESKKKRRSVRIE